MTQQIVKEYRGMLFNDLVTSPVVVNEYAISTNDKFVVKAPITLQSHSDAYLYEPELLLSCWSRSFPVAQPRGVRSSVYWRNELILTQVSNRKELRLWRDFFLSCAYECDARLKGVK